MIIAHARRGVGKIFSYVCVYKFVCLSVRSLNEKNRHELSTPKSVGVL